MEDNTATEITDNEVISFDMQIFMNEDNELVYYFEEKEETEAKLSDKHQELLNNFKERMNDTIEEFLDINEQSVVEMLKSHSINYTFSNIMKRNDFEL